MPVKFDLMKTGSAPLRQTSPAYVDPEDFSHEERAAQLVPRHLDEAAHELAARLADGRLGSMRVHERAELDADRCVEHVRVDGSARVEA